MQDDPSKPADMTDRELSESELAEISGGTFDTTFATQMHRNLELLESPNIPHPSNPMLAAITPPAIDPNEFSAQPDPGLIDSLPLVDGDAGGLKLTINDEAASNLLMQQTRQQLGTIALSLANQQQQSILRLFNKP